MVCCYSIECGEGRSLRAARCLVGGRDVPMDVCKKYHPLTGNRISWFFASIRFYKKNTQGYLEKTASSDKACCSSFIRSCFYCIFVQKSLLLLGPRRVREAATDGFTYDEEFGSLLRGTCSVRCARDCAAGAWAAWGPCAAEPGSRAAFRFRTRFVWLIDSRWPSHLHII